MGAQTKKRLRSEKGFTLIELLVVILIIGILGAIAIPAFLTQSQKGQDAAAKEGAASARTAMETYATDNNGSYVGANVAALTGIEATLANVTLAVNGADANGYDVQVTSANGHTFRILRVGGTITRPCLPVNTGGCPAGGFW